MSLANKGNITPNIKLNAVIRGTLIALALSLILSVAAGLAYHFSSITAPAIPWLVVVVLAFSSFFGSICAGKDAGSMGIYHGAAVGLALFLIIFLVGGLFLTGAGTVGVVNKLIITTIAGALGGMIGVGMS